jgi:hypothetical protein
MNKFKCRTERFWDTINDVVEKYPITAMFLSVGFPLSSVCLIPLLA